MMMNLAGAVVLSLSECVQLELSTWGSMCQKWELRKSGECEQSVGMQPIQG